MLLSVLVCGSNSAIGYYQYRDSIQDQYNEQAYNAAEDGSVLAIVTVETPMATLEARLRQYMLSSILTTAALQVDLNLYIDDLTRITAEKERIGAELNVAAKIQSDMLPCIFPAFPDYPEFDIYATMTPAKEVGGDFYDFFLVDNDHLALVMADVSGKGVPAALFMMISKTCWL